jgi:rod shape-determining protein MreC
MFKDKSSLGLRTFIWLLLSIVFIVADRESLLFHHLREKTEIAVWPLAYVADAPVALYDSVAANVSSRSALLQENTLLKSKLVFLQAKVQKMLALETDNKELLQLLQSSAGMASKMLEAVIVAISPDPFIHQVIIDKGTQQAVYEGQPVLDAHGIMGQVIQTDLLSSRVMLLTDSQSAIPVQNSRNGVRAIAVGDAQNNLLRLKAVPETADFKQGDLLIASGLGGRYPFGYPAAKIVSVSRQPNERFSLIYARPMAQLNRTRLVLLVWPKKNKISTPMKAALRPTAENKQRGHA